MARPDRPVPPAQARARKRRLHPLAIILPLGSYSRPPRLGRGMRIPRWLVMGVLLGTLGIIDIFSDDLTVSGDQVTLERQSWGTFDTAIALAAVGVLAAVLIIRWWTFRWWLADEAIWTSGGILNRWQRRVTIDDIATIDRSTSPLRRMLGVSRIQIETTAVDHAAPDVLLGYLSRRTAKALEETLMARLVFAGDQAAAEAFAPIPVDRLGWWDLFLAGATTFQATRALALIYATALLFESEMTITITLDSAGVMPLLALAGGITLVVWLASTLLFMAAFARYRLARHEGWLVVETGVIRPLRRLIRVDAIHGLEVYRSPLQRRVRRKRAMLRMRLRAYGAPSTYAMVLHPAVTDAALPDLAHRTVGMDAGTARALCGQHIHGLAPAARNAYVLRWPLVLVAFSGLLAPLALVYTPERWWWALGPLLPAPLLGLAGYLAWRSAGWHADRGAWLVIQHGGFGLTSTAARIDCIEYLTWTKPMRSRPNPNLALALSVSTSGGAGFLDRLRAYLRQPFEPGIIRVRAMSANDAQRMAAASGLERSLPPGLGGD